VIFVIEELSSAEQRLILGSVGLVALFVVIGVLERVFARDGAGALGTIGGFVRREPWVAAVGTVSAALFAVLLSELIPLWRSRPDPEEVGVTVGDLRWHATLVLGFVGAIGGVGTLFFATLRARTTERQTAAVEQSHITDQINKAVTGLGAEKTVKVHDTVADKTIERTEPNLEVRIGAIYALERIAQASDPDHVQIMEILTAYVRQNAPSKRSAAFNGRGRNGDHTAVRRWAGTLVPAIDIQAALQVIGRRTQKQIAIERDDRRYGLQGYVLDLRDTNLQGVNLSGLDLSHARLERCSLDGANLSDAALQGASLWAAVLQGAVLTGADLRGTLLISANLRAANLASANCTGAHLFEANLRGAKLQKTVLRDTNLSKIYVDKDTDFSPATLEGAGLWSADLRPLTLNKDVIKGAFGDASVKLPNGFTSGKPPLGDWSTDSLDDAQAFVRAWRNWRQTRNIRKR